MSSNDHKHSGDEYLVDRTGAPDADVERLETLLRPLGTHDDAVVPAMATSPRQRVPMLVWAAGAAAAFLAAFVVPSAICLPAPPPPVVAVVPARRPAVVRVEVPDVTDVTSCKDLTEDHWVETTDASHVLMIGDGLGRVTLGAQSRLQVRQISADTTRLYLERGSLEARVSADARPRFFQVDTDAARCVDLGCRYTLDVAAADGPAGSGIRAGDATVRVTTGQVAFETTDREVFIPAGAVCVARKLRGPGTPRFEDADDAVRAAFDALDALQPVPDAQPAPSAVAARKKAALAALDSVKGGRDTLPAWHLLQDTDADLVAAAAARLEAVAGKPGIAPGATPADVRTAWKEHLAGTCW